jgi:hypothetical protein
MKKAKSKIIKTEKEEKPEISWQASEFEYYQKDVSWYWLSLIFAIILIALSVWQKNFLFVVFIVLAWLVIVSSSRRPPTVWSFKIDEKGIQINLPNSDPFSNKVYPYEEIDGFDIHEGQNTEGDGKYKELVFKVRKRLSPYLKINFPAEQEEKIKNFLQKYIPKEEYASSLADSFSKLIRF